MPLIEADLSDVGPIEDGTYDFETIAATPGQTKKGGSKLEVDIEVDVNGTKRKRTVHLPTSGPGAFRYAQYLRAVGYGDIADRLMRKERVQFDSDQLVGTRGKVKIKGRIRDDVGHEGEPSDEVDAFMKAA